MTEPRDAQSIIDNAEQAAAAGNYSVAEDLLRQAAALQEQTLGLNHPDLANTLNNLGVVCEMADNPIDAEHYFRRAHAIASATLAPDHPFVATSRKNLDDFCAARGRPKELPPSSPEIAAWLEAPALRAAPLIEPSPFAITQDVTALPRNRSLRPVASAALSAIALLAAVLVMARSSGSGVENTSVPSTATAPAGETPAPTPTLPPAEATAPQEPTATGTEPARNEAAVVNESATSATGSVQIPIVATARLCTALSAWRCEAAQSVVPPGPLFFYTQVKSATATIVEHRWYQGDQLRSAVQLRIQANSDTGYRTYSRHAISSERAGDWRVELRSADGAVIHEERFTVR